MNRHKNNWSCMGAGLTGAPNFSNLKSKDECKELLLELFKLPNQHDQFTNICEALREIKEELNI